MVEMVLKSQLEKHLRWGIIGFGRAGQASLRAIQSMGNELASCVAIASRRCTVISGQNDSITYYAEWEDLLNDSHVDAVVICSENEYHATQVEFALQAGKHVWVHFPLCFDLVQVQQLHQLAERNHLLLHVEVFSLLGERFEHWQTLQKKDKFIRWHSHFVGGVYRWVQDEIIAKRIVTLSFARLAQAWMLLGPLTLEDTSLQYDTHSYQLSIKCTNSNGAEIQLNEARSLGAKRQQRFEVDTQTHRLSPYKSTQRNFFLLDLQYFYQRHLHQKASYLPLHDLLGIYQLMSQIESHMYEY